MAIELLTAAINVPRRGYDPVSGALRGLLIEESRTNLLLYSQQFDQAPWGNQGNVTLTPNAVAAPDGTTTAYGYALTANNGRAIYQAVPVAPSTEYAFSIYVHSPTVGVTIQVNDGDTPGAGPNFYAGTQTYPAGWSRIAVPFTTRSSLSTGNACVAFYLNGASGDNMDVWGAQLEAGAFATSYIPTTNASVTRAADDASLDASWMRSDRGCIVAEFMPRSTSISSAYPRVASVVNAATNNFSVYHYGTQAYAILNTGSPIYAVAPDTIAGMAWNKVAAAFDGASLRLVANGVMAPIVPNTVGLLSDLSTFWIGRNATGGNFLNGWLKSLRYLPYSPSDAELKALAT